MRCDSQPCSWPRRRRPAGLRRRRRCADRHLPQRHGDRGPARRAGQALRRALRPRRLRHRPAGGRRQTHQGVLLPDDRCSAATSRSPPPSGCSAAPRKRSAQGLPGARPCGRGRRPLPAARLPAAAQGAAAQDVSDGSVEYLRIAKNVKPIMGVNKANTLRLRAFNITSGPDKGHCRTPRLRRQSPGRRIHRPRRRRAAPGGPRGSSVGAIKNANGADGQLRRRRRPRAQPVLAVAFPCRTSVGA